MQVAALTQVEHKPCFTMLCVGTVSPSRLVASALKAKDVLTAPVVCAGPATLLVQACKPLSSGMLRCHNG
jgi:hypothetical protein